MGGGGGGVAEIRPWQGNLGFPRPPVALLVGYNLRKNTAVEGESYRFCAIYTQVELEMRGVIDPSCTTIVSRPLCLTAPENDPRTRISRTVPHHPHC